jgi:hypothetical protein
MQESPDMKHGGALQQTTEKSAHPNKRDAPPCPSKTSVIDPTSPTSFDSSWGDLAAPSCAHRGGPVYRLLALSAISSSLVSNQLGRSSNSAAPPSVLRVIDHESSSAKHQASKPPPPRAPSPPGRHPGEEGSEVRTWLGLYFFPHQPRLKASAAPKSKRILGRRHRSPSESFVCCFA